MKKLLMLSGVAQMCDIVENARNKGIYVIVTDYLTDSPEVPVPENWYYP